MNYMCGLAHRWLCYRAVAVVASDRFGWTVAKLHGSPTLGAIKSSLQVLSCSLELGIEIFGRESLKAVLGQLGKLLEEFLIRLGEVEA
jgi:hypothetical protein